MLKLCGLSILVILLGSCVPVPTDLTKGDTTPRISTLSPINPFLTVNSTETTKQYSISVSDPEGQGYLVEWWLDGSRETIGSLSYTFDPATSTIGTRTLTATLKSRTSDTLYDAQNWIITVNETNFFDVSPSTSIRIYAMDSYPVGETGKWYLETSNIENGEPRVILNTTMDLDGDGNSSDENWKICFYDEDLVSPEIGCANIADIDATYTYGSDEITMSDVLDAIPTTYKIDLAISSIEESNHYIEMKIFDSSLNQKGFTRRWNVTAIPIVFDISLSSIQPAENSAITVKNGGAVGAPGNWTIGAVDVDPSVTVSDGGGSKNGEGIRYEFYDTKSGLLGTYTSTSTAAVPLSTVAPGHFYSLADPNSSENYTLYARVIDVYTNTPIRSDISWPLTINPVSGVAVITSVAPANLSIIDVIDSIQVGTAGAWSTVPGVAVDTTANSPEVTFYYYNNSGCTGTETASTTPAALPSGSLYTLSDVDNTFSVSGVGTHCLEAIVNETGGVLVGSTMRWTLDVRSQNEAPLLDSPSPSISNYTMTEGVANGEVFSINYTDTDTTSGNATYSWVFVDGTIGTATTAMNGAIGTQGVWKGHTTPNCNGAGRTSCTIWIPPYNSDGPVNPSSGHKVQVTATDTVVWGGTALDSNTVEWSLDIPNEAQNAPVLHDGINVNFVNVAAIVGLDNTTNTYIFDTAGASTTSITSAVEGDPIGFNVAVYDLDRDNYHIRIDYKETATTTWVQGAISSTVTRAGVDADNIVYSESYTFAELGIPENWVDDGGPVNMDIRVVVTDDPSVASAQTASVTFSPFPITGSNPIPTQVAGSEDPLFADTSSVAVGFPFTIDAGTLDDPLWANLNDLDMQWQIRYGNVAGDDCSTDLDGWENISGATNSTLIWTPPASLDGHQACFQLCVGDSNFTGNNARVAIAGSPDLVGCGASALALQWVGLGNDFVTIGDTVSNIADITTSSTTAANLISESVGYVGGTATGTVTYSAYIINSGVNELYLVANDLNNAAGNGYDLDQNLWPDGAGGVLVGEGLKSFDNNSVTGSDLSMSVTATTSGHNIFIAYNFDDTTSIPGMTLPGARVIHYLTNTTTGTITLYNEWTSSVLHNGIGKVTSDGTNWYLPVIDANNGDQISILYDNYNAYAQGAAVSSQDIFLSNSGIASASISNVLSSTGELFLLMRNSSGDWDIEKYSSIATLLGTPSTSPAQADSSIFQVSTIDQVKMVLDESNAANMDLIIVGNNSASPGLKLRKYEDLTDLTDRFIEEDIASTSDVVAFQVVPGSSSSTADFFMIPYTDSGGNLHLLRIDGSSSTHISRKSSTSFKSFTTPSFSAAQKIFNHTAGNQGATGSENTSDSIILFYQSGAIAPYVFNGFILNSEPITVSDDDVVINAGSFTGFLN